MFYLDVGVRPYLCKLRSLLKHAELGDQAGRMNLVFAWQAEGLTCNARGSLACMLGDTCRSYRWSRRLPLLKLP